MNGKRYAILTLYLIPILSFACSTHSETQVDNKELIQKSEERQQAKLQERINDNNMSIKKLQSYEIGLTTEDEFWKDGWNGNDPYKERIGVIAFKKQSGTNQYTMGHYLGYAGEPIAINASLEFYRLMIENENAEYDINKLLSVGAPAKSVHVCELLFKNNMLETIRFIK
jgi:hypothetical protein